MLDTLRYHMSLGKCRTSMIGNQPSIESVEQAETLVQRALGLNLDVCLMKPARDKNSKGFQSVANFVAGKEIYADATILLEPNSAVVFQVADCPGLILHDNATGMTGVAHVGRPAATPYGEEQHNVISHLMRRLGYRLGDLIPNVSVLITPCISAENFRHDFHDEARELAEPFLHWHKGFPEEHIFTDVEKLQLDMRAFIKTYLRSQYSDPQHVVVGTQCTFETTGFASRRQDTGQNKPAVDRLFNTCIVYRKNR